MANTIQIIGGYSDSAVERQAPHKPFRRVLGNPEELDFALLQFDHWKWNLCGGDLDGDDTFAFYNEECAEQQGVPKDVFFVAGVESEGGSRACSVSDKDTIFVPIINTLWWAIPGRGDVECDDVDTFCKEELLKAVSEIQFETVTAVLDGEDISSDVLDLTGYIPEFNLEECSYDLCSFGLPQLSVITWQAVARGLWLALPPLDKGEHVLELAGNDGLPPGRASSLDFSIILNVK